MTGTTQGCPLSMILYAFYNAPLLEAVTPRSRDEFASGFVDNIMFLAIADMLEKAQGILQDIMQRPQGGLDWSRTHHSPLEFSKLGLMNFP